jgi:hypothetical protein
MAVQPQLRWGGPKTTPRWVSSCYNKKEQPLATQESANQWFPNGRNQSNYERKLPFTSGRKWKLLIGSEDIAEKELTRKRRGKPKERIWRPP